jgi:hypothetical protein
MIKPRKNPAPRSWAVHAQSQKSQGVSAAIGPVSNLQGKNLPPIYVGGVSESSHNPIRFDQAENIVQAAGYALSIGCPLEFHLTVKWPIEPGDHAKAYNCHKALLINIGEWQEYNIGKRVFVWSRERKGGDHSHILLYCPRNKKPKLQKLVRKWIRELFKLRSLPTGTIQFTTHRKFGCSFDHMRNRVRYILKGADPDTRHFLGCTKAEQTHIKGKRAGVSQDLNRKARCEAGAVQPSGAKKPTREMLEAVHQYHEV